MEEGEEEGEREDGRLGGAGGNGGGDSSSEEEEENGGGNANVGSGQGASNGGQENVDNHGQRYVYRPDVRLCPTYRNGLRTIDQFIEVEYSRYFNVGSMDKVCIHCDARYWVEEQNTKKQCTNCCESGKISIPPFSEPPEVIRDMLWGLPENATRFLSASRRINTAVSFASIHMKDDRTIPATVPTIRVNGSVYHNVGPLYAKNHETFTPKFLQLYF